MKILNITYERYFKYLCDLVHLGKGNNHELLARALFETDYMYIILDDENGEMDGIVERERFAYNECKNSEEVIDMFKIDDFPCSVFEHMLGLARRISDATYDIENGSKLYPCFHVLLDNLNISQFNDDIFDRYEVERILNNYINRKYKPNGQGGLFPLRYTTRDEREVPIRLQLTAFLNEHDYKLPKSLGFI